MPGQMKATMTPTASSKSLRSVMLQRKCACGGTLGPAGECEDCRKKKLQRSAMHRDAPALAPPLIHEVLRSSGQPLDANTHALMESRFGYSFRDVRVHTEAKAAESARAVNALAYAVGRDIVFDAGQYAPQSPAGQKLLAHELTHVVQQGSSQCHGRRDLAISTTSNASEREAEAAAISVMTGRTVNVSNSHVVSLARREIPELEAETGEEREARKEAEERQHEIERRQALIKKVQSAWTVSGNIATASNEFATIGGLRFLAKQTSGREEDWVCIKPVKMRAVGDTASESRKLNYDKLVQLGDQFDISNLTAQTGPALAMFLFAGGGPDAEIVRRFYPGAVPSGDPDADIDKAANSGGKPIKELLLVGHASGDHMFGVSSFRPSDYSPADPSPSYDLAKIRLFPRRCWLTRNATARLIGCDSEIVGRHFANTYLRIGANVTTTTRGIRTVCSGQPIGTPCEHPNALEFVAPSILPELPPDTVGGPFRTVGDFQSSSFWATLPGNL